jgi:hypothetical protein
MHITRLLFHDSTCHGRMRSTLACSAYTAHTVCVQILHRYHNVRISIISLYMETNPEGQPYGESRGFPIPPEEAPTAEEPNPGEGFEPGADGEVNEGEAFLARLEEGHSIH